MEIKQFRKELRKAGGGWRAFKKNALAYNKRHDVKDSPEALIERSSGTPGVLIRAFYWGEAEEKYTHWLNIYTRLTPEEPNEL